MENQDNQPIATYDGRPLGIQEAARYSGLSPKYLYKLACQHKIAYFKPNGGRLYFTRKDIDAYIFRGRRAADFELREKANQAMHGEPL